METVDEGPSRGLSVVQQLVRSHDLILLLGKALLLEIDLSDSRKFSPRTRTVTYRRCFLVATNEMTLEPFRAIMRALCLLDNDVKEDIEPGWLCVLDGLANIARCSATTSISASPADEALALWKGLGEDLVLEEHSSRLKEMETAASAWNIPLTGCSRLRCPLHGGPSGARRFLRCCGCGSVSK